MNVESGERVMRPLGPKGPGGKSELRRARWSLTATGRKPRESATESKPPMARRRPASRQVVTLSEAKGLAVRNYKSEILRTRERVLRMTVKARRRPCGGIRQG